MPAHLGRLHSSITMLMLSGSWKKHRRMGSSFLGILQDTGKSRPPKANHAVPKGLLRMSCLLFPVERPLPYRDLLVQEICCERIMNVRRAAVDTQIAFFPSYFLYPIRIHLSTQVTPCSWAVVPAGTSGSSFFFSFLSHFQQLIWFLPYGFVPISQPLTYW